MFRVLKQQLAWWPVTFAGVAEDGKVVANEIEVQFLILDEDEMLEYVELQRAPLTEEEAKLPASQQAARRLLPIVKNWRKVGGENGEPLPFNEENLARLIRVPNAGEAIGKAYGPCRRGQPKEREGN